MEKVIAELEMAMAHLRKASELARELPHNSHNRPVIQSWTLELPIDQVANALASVRYHIKMAETGE